MEKIVIKEVIKKVEEKPVSAPKNSDYLSSKSFKEQMKYFDYSIINNEVIINKVIKGSQYMVIPSGVNKIAANAFGKVANSLDEKIETIEIPSSVYEIGEQAFMANNYIKKIILSDSSVRVINSFTFNYAKNLEFIALPNCIQEIKEKAFNKTSLKEVFIPRTAKFDPSAFDDTTMYLLGYPSERDLLIKEYKENINKQKQLKELKYQIDIEYKKKKEALKKTLDEKLNNLKDTIKEKQKEISLLDKQVETKSSLTKQDDENEKSKIEEEIKLLKTQIEVKKGLYINIANCILKDILIPEDVDISKPLEKMFAKINKRLQKVHYSSMPFEEKTLIEKLENIKARAKRSVKKEISSEEELLMKELISADPIEKQRHETYDDKIKFFGDELIDVKKGNNKLIIPSFINKVALSIFENKDIDTLIIEGKCNRIENLEEQDVKNIKTLVLVDSESINSHGFINPFRNNVETIILKGNIKDIARMMFKEFKNLKQVIIDTKSDISILDYAFNNCKKLEKVDFNKVSSIGLSAFENCESLKEIVSNTIKQIGACAFKNCYNLKKVDFIDKDSIPKDTSLYSFFIYRPFKILDKAFEGINKIDEIHLYGIGGSYILNFDKVFCSIENNFDFYTSRTDIKDFIKELAKYANVKKV